MQSKNVPSASDNEVHDWSEPSGHDKELDDSERAHSGVPGGVVRHGAGALKSVPAARYAPTSLYDSHYDVEGASVDGLEGPP